MRRARSSAGPRKRRADLRYIWVFIPAVALAQVLSPPEIGDLQMRELQQKHLADLKTVARSISSHAFPYRLYFSRTLDLSEEQQQRSDQRSIRFEKFRNQTVVEITANYYASYSADLMKKEERARRTMQDIMVPMLEAAVPVLGQEEKLQAFAIEISHHIRRKVLGVSTENAENVAFILPRAAALRLISANTQGEKEAALIEGVLFVDGKPVDGWGHAAREMTAENKTEAAAPPPDTKAAPGTGVWPPAPERGVSGALPALPPAPSVNPNPLLAAGIAAVPQQDISRESLGKLQSSHQETLDRLVRELDKEAHFVSYAPPVFIAFHKGAYLALSMTTTLKESGPGSQYRVAALAFDEHVAHLIRPVLSAFKTRPGFDGIDFSTSVRPAAAGANAESVEFIFPTAALLCYEQYDCTGQQLINQGFVLINGERVSLDLQSAEAGVTGQR